MIDVKQAVGAAISFARQLYPDHISDLGLEEVELTEDERYWLVTVGFDRLEQPITVPSAIQALGVGPKRIRVYKVIKVNAETGDAVAMKIRPTATAI